MAETNRIEFTGTIERLQQIKTRTGQPMSRWLLKVGKDRFCCIAFGNIAETVVWVGEGVQVNVIGSGAINSWKTQDDQWRNDFQVSVWKLTSSDGEEFAYARPGKEQPPIPPEPDDLESYSYQGGPF